MIEILGNYLTVLVGLYYLNNQFCINGKTQKRATIWISNNWSKNQEMFTKYLHFTHNLQWKIKPNCHTFIGTNVLKANYQQMMSGDENIF